MVMDVTVHNVEAITINESRLSSDNTQVITIDVQTPNNRINRIKLIVTDNVTIPLVSMFGGVLQ